MADYTVLKPENNSKPFVSIYCLVYNHEEYLKDCLNGILMQNVDFSYEIVAHDDASTDKSVEILQEYRRKYPDKFKLILQKENQYSKGVHVLNDFVFPYLEGKYVAVCEGDDFWTDKDKLRKQVDFLEKNQEYSACVHNCIKWHLREHTKTVMYSCEKDYDISFEQVAQGGSSCYQMASLVHRKEYLDKLPQFFTMVTSYSDYTLAMYLALEGKIRFMNETMSVYRFFSSGSLAERSMDELNEIKCKKQEATLNMLKEVDRYSDYRYHDTLVKLTDDYEYSVAELRNDYKVLNSKKYIERFTQKGFKYRMKVMIKYYLSGLYGFYKKVRY